MSEPITLFLCGDVMTGRGIDQALPHPCSPELYEGYVRDARDYVRLAERHSGSIKRPMDYGDLWGVARDELERFSPEVRLINLETSITRHPGPLPGKGIHYRMHPDNAACLTAVNVNACALANNHVLDWQREGLAETLQVLDDLGIPHAGAGLERLEHVEAGVD
ncbi:MAG: CapA family protein, partial [Marinobacter sp.]